VFKRREKYILRDNTRRSLKIKYRYINLLEKSLFYNRTLKNKKRLLAFLKINFKKLSMKKVKNICMKSGESKAVNKKLLICRFQINYIGILNKLQNFKVNSW
jgi:ribosomal protein S14